MKQAGADITGQLQVRPMLYTLYIDINLRVVKMIHTDNKQQITTWIQSPSKRRYYVCLCVQPNFQQTKVFHHIRIPHSEILHIVV